MSPAARRLHIAMFTPDLSATAGGPPRVVLGSAAALRALGHRVTIFAMDGDADGSDTHILPRDRPRAAGRSRALRRAVSARLATFDLLHIHAIWEMEATALARMFRAAGKPVVVSAHGMLDRWSMRQSRAKKQLALRVLGVAKMLRTADAVVFASEDERDEAIAAMRIDRPAIVPNGVDPTAIERHAAGGAATLRTRFAHMAGWQRTIVYFSRIHRKKGLDDLVSAFLGMAPGPRTTGLLVIGIAQDDGLRDEVLQRVAAAGAQDRFALTTDLTGDAAKAALSAADLFVLPSHQEGFSIAILEAMALGLPVVITDKCHLPDVASKGAGMVVGDNPADLRRGLDAMLALFDDDLRAMGAAGRRMVEERYSWDRVGASLDQLYAQCVARS